MPIFDVSFLNPNVKRSGGAGYDVLVDHISILEKQLSSDGKLSPGDYDYLRSEAAKLRNAPGLNAGQRSNLDVKIANYESLSKTTGLRDAQNLENLNRSIQNDTKTLVYGYGNDPATFLKGKMTVLEGKIFRLRENAIDQERAGDVDVNQTLLELDKTRNEWLDTQAAISGAENYQKGGTPVEGFVANIETNTNGEIRDIKISKGTEPGHVLTTGVLGGFTIAGKVNPRVSAKEGKNIFKIGDVEFSAPSILRPGPNGELQSQTLTAASQQTSFGSRGRTKSVGNFIDLDPISIRPQKASLPGEWIQSTDGSFYRDTGSGRYERYIGATKENLGIDDFDLLKNLPNDILQTVKRGTVKTHDLSSKFQPQVTLDAVPDSSGQAAVTETPTTSPGPSFSRTPSPLARAPQKALGIASQTIGKATSFLKGLFGQ